MPSSKHKTNTNTRELPLLFSSLLFLFLFLFVLSSHLLFSQQLLQHHVTFKDLLFQLKLRPRLSLSLFYNGPDQQHENRRKKANSSCFFLALNWSPCGPMCRAVKPRVLDSQQRTHLVGCASVCVWLSDWFCWSWAAFVVYKSPVVSGGWKLVGPSNMWWLVTQTNSCLRINFKPLKINIIYYY